MRTTRTAGFGMVIRERRSWGLVDRDRGRGGGQGKTAGAERWPCGLGWCTIGGCGFRAVAGPAGPGRAAATRLSAAGAPRAAEPSTVPMSIFLDFNLPNATTWFYLSWVLAVALFFKFNRLLSLRNWDLLSLFLLVPGLLLLQEEYARAAAAGVKPDIVRLWFGYFWLVAGSFYFFVRCVVDLALVRRPALA